MKKLLMSKGMSRNDAELVRKHIRIFDESGGMWSNAMKAACVVSVERKQHKMAVWR